MFTSILLAIKMNKSTLFLLIAFALSLIGCFFFAFLWIDTLVTLKYADSSYEQNLALHDLRFLLEKEWAEISEQELFEKIKLAFNEHPEVIIFNKENTIIVDVIDFEFQNGKLKSIDILNVPSSNRSLPPRNP